MNSIKILLRKAGEAEFQFDVMRSETAYTVSLRLGELISEKPEKIILMYKGKQLSNNTTIEEAGIV